MKKFIIKNQNEMKNLAAEIADQSRKGHIIGLKGTLGAGKSFFASAFINSLSEKKTEVLSPTFNLVYSYQTKKGEVFHFDLYRIKTPAELYNIGLEDALINGISLIEWPEIAKDFCRKNYTEIEIEMISEEERMVIIK
jgi:tRNA threonylcarbamoyladenosine biosynthesis protein TsaE